MIWAQWGMKERLFDDPEVFLCHQCGDCTEICPRGAKPAEVLGAIRAYLYTLYGWPAWLARLAADIKNLPILLGGPAIIILVIWLLSGATHIPSTDVFARNGYTQFFGHWDFKWYLKNAFFIVSIIVPAAGLAVYSVFRGIRTMWQRMSKRANLQIEYRPSFLMFFTEFLWPSLVETMKHNRFRECTANTDRVKGHLPLVLGFIGAFILTCWSAFRQDLMGLIWPSFHGPLPLTDPFKTLANISAIALLYGVWVLWRNRLKLEQRGKASRTFYDWFLIWEIVAVGITGLGAELLRRRFNSGSVARPRYSRAARAAPTPKLPMIGRVRAKVFIARANPLPGSARIFSLSTRTFLKLIPTVLEQRWPILGIARPIETPGHLVSTEMHKSLCFDFLGRLWQRLRDSQQHPRW